MVATVAVALLAGPVVGPSAAQAETEVSYFVDDGEENVRVENRRGKNSIELEYHSRAYFLTDTQRIVFDGDGACDRLDARRVRCAARRGTLLDFSIALGRGDDRLTIARSVPNGLSGFGGAGNDVMRGGTGKYETLNGGEGSDVVRGRGGSDYVFSGGGRHDRLYGNGGNDLVSVNDFSAVPSKGAVARGGPGEDDLDVGDTHAKLLDCGPGRRDSVAVFEGNRSRVRNCEEALVSTPARFPGHQRSERSDPRADGIHGPG